MKTPYLAALALACFALPSARTQDVEYTDAISRRVLMLNQQPVEYTDAISRRVLMLNQQPVEYTDAISRRTLMFNANLGVAYDDANSRRVLLYIPPYTTDEAEKAVRIAAGLLTATPANLTRLNIIIDEGSADKLDFRDAARIMRMAVGLDW